MLFKAVKRPLKLEERFNESFSCCLLTALVMLPLVMLYCRTLPAPSPSSLCSQLGADTEALDLAALKKTHSAGGTSNERTKRFKNH